VRVEAVVEELSQDWLGESYDLLARNCNHFCDAFCVRLGVERVPLWVNRFANAGDAAILAVGNTIDRLIQAKDDVVLASSRAMQFMFGSSASSSAPPTLETPGNTSITHPGTPLKISYNSSPLSSVESGSVISTSDDDDVEHSSPPPPA
jgi:hypothetical protein